MDRMKIYGLMVLVTVSFATYAYALDYVEVEAVPVGVDRFASYEELENFVSGRTDYDRIQNVGGWAAMEDWTGTIALSPASESVGFDIDESVSYNIPTTTEGGVDYSGTNVQVTGVDEADIVKTDGEYIYVVSGSSVFIVDAVPAGSSQVLSEIELDGTPIEIYINGDKLVVFTRGTGDYQYYAEEMMVGMAYWYSYYYGTTIQIYDISDRENPIPGREISMSEADYHNSRMIGDFVYVVLNQQIYSENLRLPRIQFGATAIEVPATEIYYFDYPDYSYGYTIVLSVNVHGRGGDDREVFLTGDANDIYVSTGNIYVTRGGYENTAISRLAISNGSISLEATGQVPGTILNQFSMDEYNGYFRVATTVGWNEYNNIYVLDMDLDVVGSRTNIAPGEEIYSARFMGDRAYLVTFMQVDPLFVIDLADPENPRILGELKIPGYSDYLHPYDETHLIGVGKEATEEGFYQGVKIALFDVSDPDNPIVMDNLEIGTRGTDSYALHDHHAFLFSRSKNLLAIPILLAEEQWSYTWQGAYVYDISLDGGLDLRGTVTHFEDDDEVTGSWWYYGTSDKYIKRSLYIEDTLYTVSDGMVKANSLDDLSEVGSVELPVSESPVSEFAGEISGLGI